jgi:hypothetical protein
MEIENGKHTTREHSLHQRNGDDSVKFRATWWRHDRADRSPDISSIITIETGRANLHIDISPAEARSLAASLIAHAVDVETAPQQLQPEVIPA